MTANNTTEETSTRVQHQSYLCPGLHGNEQQHTLKVLTFERLLQEFEVELPLFQRKYCWDETQFSRLWVDLDKVAGRRASHHFGKTIWTPIDGNEVRKTCIDGQQRVTTSCLVISAIRDAMLGALERAGAVEGDDDAAAGFELVARLETLLFLDPDKARAWDRSVDSLSLGETIDFVRLLPTYDDRDMFYALLLARRPAAEVQGDPNMSAEFAARMAGSSQYACKKYFDERLRTLGMETGEDDEGGDAAGEGQDGAAEAGDGAETTAEAEAANEPVELPDLATATAALVAFADAFVSQLQIIYYELESAEYSQQVFQYIQERSTVASQLIENKTPGQYLEATDLVRNLLMSYFIDDMAEQEAVYRDRWLPLERAARACIGGHLSKGIDEFVEVYLRVRHPEAAEYHFSYRTFGEWKLEVYFDFVGLLTRMLEGKDPAEEKQIVLEVIDDFQSVADTYDECLDKLAAAIAANEAAAAAKTGGSKSTPAVDEETAAGGSDKPSDMDATPAATDAVADMDSTPTSASQEDAGDDDVTDMDATPTPPPADEAASATEDGSGDAVDGSGESGGASPAVRADQMVTASS